MSLFCFACPFLFIYYLNSDFSLLKLCVISDSYISYLPLAHIYERTNQILSVYYGVAIGFYQGVGDSTQDCSFSFGNSCVFEGIKATSNRIGIGTGCCELALCILTL